MTSTGTIDLSSDSNPNDVQIIIPWEIELRNDAVYKTSNAIFLMRSKYDPLSLTDMRQRLNIL
jgi:hypothetical protein